MDFHTYMKTIVNSGGPGNCNDKKFGTFRPSCGLIEMNISFDEYSRRREDISNAEYYKNWTPDSHLWPFTYLHELCHCYQIMGSSLGSLNVITHDLLSFYQDDILNYYSDYPEDDYFSLYRNNVDSEVIEAVESFKTPYDIRAFIDGSCSPYFQSRYYIPKIKDYLHSFYRGIFYIHIWRDHHDLIEISESSEQINLVNEIKKDKSRLIDLRIPWSGDIERIMRKSIFEKNFCFNKVENALIIPTHAIVEGYARHTECVFRGYNNSRFDGSISCPSDLHQINDGINKSLQEKMAGIYGVVNEILEAFLGWIEKEKGIIEYFDTCSAIYELSLMTRYHPSLFDLEGWPDPKIEECLIPLRFKKVLNYFVDKKKSISDFCDPEKNMLKGLDNICSQIEFVEYSKCLEALYEQHRFKMFEYIYPNSLICEIIRQKLNSHPFFDHWNIKEGILPVVTLFDDGIHYSPSESFEELVVNNESDYPDINEFDDENLKETSYLRMIKEQTFEEIILRTDFKKTKALYHEYYKDYGDEFIQEVIRDELRL